MLRSAFFERGPGRVSAWRPPRQAGSGSFRWPNVLFHPIFRNKRTSTRRNPPQSRAQPFRNMIPRLALNIHRFRQCASRSGRDEKERASRSKIGSSPRNTRSFSGSQAGGKSTLLRFIALDMLSASPKLVDWRKRMPDYLPVWVSFAFWTKLIAADNDKCSLIDAIEAWFRRQDEPDLIALVRKAYDDKRLLLLVDGIDEWENETAANTAFGLLQSFTERHANPVIVTSRPHGYRLITGLDGSWRVSRIAPLKPDQQVALARTWFAHLNSSGEDRQRVEARSLAQATAFVAELRRNGPMAELATIPLLLTGLIALKSAQLALPRNRFVAYEELTKLLLDLHPTARDKAAFAGGSRLRHGFANARDSIGRACLRDP